MNMSNIMVRYILSDESKNIIPTSKENLIS